MHRAEFGIVWVTFLAINLTTLEVGMAIGVVVSCLGFIVQYSLTGTAVGTSIAPQSNIVRGYEQREILSRQLLSTRPICSESPAQLTVDG